MRSLPLTFLICVFLFLCLSFRHFTQTEIESIHTLRLLGETVIPYNKPYKSTTIGGLSGIDYDPSKDEYYLISDDRSAINPARFYKAKIHYSDKGIDSVQFTDVNFMLQPDGKTYPNSKQDAAGTPDPESIRFNPKLNQLIWTSEGERVIKGKDSVFSNPSINIMQKDGKFLSVLPIPPNLVMQRTENGPRKNGTLEGLTFGEDYNKIYVSLEEPLYEDGPKIDLKENHVPIRIYQFDASSLRNTAQFAYIPDPVAYPAIPETAFRINGIPEIFYIGKHTLLVIERSFSTGRLPCTVKVFLADLSKADNVISISSLKDHPPLHPVSKKLLLNMDTLGMYIDNIEGVTWGKDLPNGHKTLIFVADNNFELFQRTQFLVFEVIP